METKISVLLADPGEQYRAAYSKAIGQETDMELVAQTDNGLRAEELITKFQPDVVVLDLVLPNLDGLSLLTHLRAKNASSRVIVTSAICNDQVLIDVIPLLYVLKNFLETAFLAFCFQFVKTALGTNPVWP